MKITCNNSKGGVGKSTSVIVISQLLAVAGYKVLVIDLDPQLNSTKMFIGEEEIIPTTDILVRRFKKEKEVLSFVQKTAFNDNLDIIPGNRELSDTLYELYELSKENDNSELILKENLSLIEHMYDYILVDTSPFKSYLTYSCIGLADIVLTPIEADNFSYDGLRDLLNTIQYLNEKHDLEIKFGGIFITMIDARTTRYKQISEGYEMTLGEKYIPTAIRKCEAIGQSSTNFVPILQWDKKCTAVIDYINLIVELNLIDNKHFKRLSEFLKIGKLK